MKIVFASDHRGYKLKKELINRVEKELGYICLDVGCNDEQRCDFPVFSIKASELVANNEADYGIVICGSGDGVCIASNKVKGIRCTLVVNKEDAKRAKEHVNANVLAMGSEKTNLDEAFLIVENLVKSEFLKDRHLDRIKMIEEYEDK